MTIDYDAISPGVRDLVRELNELGYTTTDSGDGSNHAAGMECALPYRHVFINAPTPRAMIVMALALARRYRDARVEVTWSPGEPAIVMLFPDGAPT